MVKHGYTGQIHNIDICEHVIALMRERNSKTPSLTYAVMDCTEMTFAPNSFEAVIDKGTALWCTAAKLIHSKGCLDALMCGSPLTNEEKVAQFLASVLRCVCALSHA
jgi:hypothetical protein